MRVMVRLRDEPDEVIEVATDPDDGPNADAEWFTALNFALQNRDSQHIQIGSQVFHKDIVLRVRPWEGRPVDQPEEPDPE